MHFGIPLESLQGNKASSRVEAGNSGYLCSSDWDLRDPIEFQKGSQSSSHIETWYLVFLSSFTRSVRPSVDLMQGTWAFSTLATGESDLPLCYEEILRVPFESVQGLISS